MKLLLIGSTVDDGSASITHAFIKALRPTKFIDIKKGLKLMTLRDLLILRREVRQASKEIYTVICIHHSSILIGGFFLPIRRYKSITAYTDWTRAFPSRRKDLSTRFHTFWYLLLIRRFDKVFCPAPDLNRFFLDQYRYRMEPILLPPPYDSPVFAPLCTDETQPRVLFIGADFRRKGGEVLMQQWKEFRPGSAVLTLVSSNAPHILPDGVDVIDDLKPRTERHVSTLGSHHLFVLPSYREAYGFSALEALNFGLVVAVTRVAGIAHLVERSGGIVEDTPEKVVAAALELAKRPAELRQRQAKVREFMLNYRNLFDQQLQSMVCAD